MTRAEGLAWVLCVAALILPEIIKPGAMLPPAGQRGFLWLFPVLALAMAWSLRSAIGAAAALFIVLLQWAGVVHYQYFGVYFRKKDFGLLGAEFDDLVSGLLGTLETWRMSALGLCAGLVLISVARALMSRSSRLGGAALVGLVLLPLYMALTLPAWRMEPDNRRPALVNVLYAWGGFLEDRLSPQAHAAGGRAWLGYQVRERPDWAAVDARAPVSIVLIVGESLNPDHMSVLGYGRETTPRLAEMVRRHEGGASRIMGAGISTRVSLPMLLNVVREPGNDQALRQAAGNLFGGAKRHGYQTAFISVQKMDGLSSMMGGRTLDHWVDAVDRPVTAEVPDAELVTRVRESPIRWDRPFMLVLNTRSAHIPYGGNFPSSFAHFSRAAAGTRDRRVIDEYDDAVRWFDLQVARTVDFIMGSARGPVLFVLVSDHGEMVGWEGRIGHNVLHPEVYKTPLLWFANPQAQAWSRALRAECVGNHHMLGLFMLRTLGWDLHNPNVRPDGADAYWVNGNDIDGDNGQHRYRLRDVPFVDARCKGDGPGGMDAGPGVLMSKR